MIIYSMQNQTAILTVHTLHMRIITYSMSIYEYIYLYSCAMYERLVLLPAAVNDSGESHIQQIAVTKLKNKSTWQKSSSMLRK